jgi:hypothetical protein
MLAASTRDRPGTHDLSFLMSRTSINMRTVSERAFANYQIEERLRSQDLGIAGLSDLYHDSMTRYTDLTGKVTNDATSNLIKEQLGDFFFAIQGRKSCSEPTAAALTLMHMSATRKEFDLIVRQAFMAGADLNIEEITSLSSQAVTTGSFGERQCSAESIKSMDPEQMVGIFRLAATMASRDSDNSTSFTEAYENYMDMDLSRYLTSIEAMAREEWLYNTAETLFGGQFMEPFFRYSTTSSALHQAVQKELRKTVDQDSRYNKLTASWESAKQKISAAFDMARRKGTLVTDTTDQEPPTAGGPARQMSAHPVGILKDMNMKCERLEAPECTPEFIHSISDQERYTELKLDSLPKGCNACRKWRAEKAAKAGRSKPCPEFRQDGKCQFGDQCRYSHNIKPMSAHLIQQDPTNEESKEEEYESEIDSDDSSYMGW